MARKAQWQRYLVRWWFDPYNERGEYRELEQHVANKRKAIEIAEQTGERALVLDLFKDGLRLIYHRELSDKQFDALNEYHKHKPASKQS